MSKQDQYLKLWQQKRNELQVDLNPQGDWLAMHNLLDQQLPVVKGKAGNGGTGSNLAKQLSHFTKFKLFYIAAALITSVVVTYTVIRHNATIKAKKPAKTEVRTDSVLNNNADTTLINDQPADSTVQQNLFTDSTAGNVVSSKGITGNDSNGRNATATSLSPDKSNEGKKPGEAGGKSTTGNSNAVTRQIGRLGNTQPATTSVNSRPDNLSRSPKSNAAVSRLMSSANNINNGVARLKSKSDKASNKGVVTPGSRQGTVGNTTQQADVIGKSSVANGSNFNALNSAAATNQGQTDEPKNNELVVQSLPSPFVINPPVPALINNYTTAGMANKAKAASAKSRLVQPVVTKVTKDKTPKNENLDWGILLGVNTLGSFTPKDQNKNIYGSLPIDAYAGLFATYDIKSKWAVDMQVKLLVPHTISGTYDHTFSTRNDTGQVVRQVYKISDTRKVYSIQVPLHLSFKLTNNVSIKAGPVINLPIKYFGNSSLTATTDTVIDSIGYAGRLADTIHNVTFKKKLSVGFSGGISFAYKRLRFEAIYYRSSKAYQISSPAGGYSAGVNNVQLTVGFKLNRSKGK